MDDQQGKLIDGTARARQWRRSRPKSRAAADGTEVRSDAPKSIAASLLVPAEMLEPGAPPTSSGAPAPRDCHSVLTTESPSLLVPEDHLRAADHVNPFLAPERFEADAPHPGAPRRRLLHLIRRVVDGISRRRAGSLDHKPGASILVTRRSGVRLARVATVALGGLVGLAVMVAVLEQSPPSGRVIGNAQGGQGSARSLEPLKSALLAAATNPFGSKNPVRGQPRRIRPPVVSSRPQRSRAAASARSTPVRATIRHVVVPAN
jgi:hypothetical protein